MMDIDTENIIEITPVASSSTQSPPLTISETCIIQEDEVSNLEEEQHVLETPLDNVDSNVQSIEICSDLCEKEELNIILESGDITMDEDNQAIWTPPSEVSLSNPLLSQECLLYQYDDKTYKITYSNNPHSASTSTPAPETPASPKPVPPEKSPGKFTCDFENCGRQFTTMGYLKVHQLVHNYEKPMTCNYEDCKRKFSWPAHLKYHKMTHVGKRPFRCDHLGCGKAFYTSQRLQIHGRTHTGVRPYMCDVEGCGKSFTTAGNLKNHTRIHTGSKPYSCEVEGCGKSFTELSSLKKHKVVHTGQKPFKCDVCGQLFSQSASRNVHIKKAHNKTEMASLTSLVETVAQTTEDTPQQYSQGILVISESGTKLHIADKVVTFATQPVSLGFQELKMANPVLAGPEQNMNKAESTMTSSSTNVVVISEPVEIGAMATALQSQQDDMPE